MDKSVEADILHKLGELADQWPVAHAAELARIVDESTLSEQVKDNARQLYELLTKLERRLTDFIATQRDDPDPARELPPDIRDEIPEGIEGIRILAQIIHQRLQNIHELPASVLAGWNHFPSWSRDVTRAQQTADLIAGQVEVHNRSQNLSSHPDQPARQPGNAPPGPGHPPGHPPNSRGKPGFGAQ